MFIIIAYAELGSLTPSVVVALSMSGNDFITLSRITHIIGVVIPPAGLPL
ncbi:MAG TPA: hypothetical protein VH796_02370 [Nitrososphaeraceae archaeon]|jgi:hypothetical protein